MRLKIQGSNPDNYVVTNADTNEVIEGIQSITMHMNHTSSYATINVINPIVDVTTEDVTTGLITLNSSNGYDLKLYQAQQLHDMQESYNE